MMKKAVCLALAMLLMLVLSALALSEESSGMWIRSAFLDEFNMPTDDYYISNSQPITGTFNDSVSSDQRLTVQLFMRLSDSTVSLRLSEYGRSIVKNSSNMYAKTYDVTMLDPAGERHYMSAEIPTGGDAVIFDEDDSALIVDALAAGGPVRFAMTQSAIPTNKYIFSIEDTMDFADYLPYTHTWKFTEGLASVKKGNKWGFIDTTGKTVVPFQWDFVYPFDEGYAVVFSGTVTSYDIPDTGYYGLIDTTGELIIPCEWTKMHSYAEGLALVQRDNKWGFIDISGETVIPFEWDDAVRFIDGFARVKKDGKWGFIDTTGELVIPCQWDYTGNFDDGIAIVFNGALNQYGSPSNGQYGYIDTEGNPIVACEFDKAYSFCEGFAAVQKNGKWGFIDRSGKTIVPCTLDKVGDFSEGLAWVFVGTLDSYGSPDTGKYGYVDSTGTLVIPCLWDNAGIFSQGLAPVSQNGLYGFIDTSGELVIPYQWDVASIFNSGVSIVKENKQYGLVNTEGTLINSCQWDGAVSLGNGFTAVRTGDYFSGSYGALDAFGNLVIPCEYDDLRYGDGYFVLLKGGELVICDSEGNRTN